MLQIVREQKEAPISQHLFTRTPYFASSTARAFVIEVIPPYKHNDI